MSFTLPVPNIESDKRSLLNTHLETSSPKKHDMTSSVFHIKDNPLPPISNGTHHLDVPLRTSFRPSLDTISDISIYSADNVNERRTGRPQFAFPAPRLSSTSPVPSVIWKSKRAIFWDRNKGMALVLLAMLFGAMMNVTTRLLVTQGSHGRAMHPFQILFARMSITLVLSSIYMWWAKVPDFPFGNREVRGLLVARGLGGFFGVYGLYYSLQYLELGEATVITFLAPIVACWACSILLHEPFTRMEQIAGIISLAGVVMIARPSSLFSSHTTTLLFSDGLTDSVPSINSTLPIKGYEPLEPTPAQRLSAVLVAMIGVFGAASAYTFIRWIGKRAHPLISVNFFAIWCTFVSAVTLLVFPGIDFRLPSGILEWTYLIALGISGFIMQFLLTAGLQHEKSSRATNMVYTQMLFALASDKLVFDSTPGPWSIAGSSLILGSAVYVAVQGNRVVVKKSGEGRGGEEGRLVGEEGEGPDRLRGVQEVQLRTIRI